MAQRIAFDLTEEDFAENEGFALIEEGTYDVEISECEMKNSKNKGTLSYNIRYKSEGFKGNLFEDVWITPKTLGKSVKAFVKATGRGPVPTLADPSIPEADELIGAELQVTVVHEEYENVTRAKVKGFSHKAIGSGGSTKSNDGSFVL